MRRMNNIFFFLSYSHNFNNICLSWRIDIVSSRNYSFFCCWKREERIELSCASLGVTGLSVCRLGEHFNENSEIIFLILLKGTFLDYGKHLTATRQRSGQRNSRTLYTSTHQKGEWRAQWETWGVRTSRLLLSTLSMNTLFLLS